MNNYELNSRAQELADTHDKYRLARKLIVAEEELAELRDREKPQEEPVAWRWNNHGWHITQDEWSAACLEEDGVLVFPLYRQPPAPAAVPESDRLAEIVSRFLNTVWTANTKEERKGLFLDAQRASKAYRESAAPAPADPDKGNHKEMGRCDHFYVDGTIKGVLGEYCLYCDKEKDK